MSARYHKYKYTHAIQNIQSKYVTQQHYDSMRTL